MKKKGRTGIKEFVQSAVMAVSCMGMLYEIVDISFSAAAVAVMAAALACLSFFRKNKRMLAAAAIMGIVLCLINLFMQEWSIWGMKDFWNHAAAVLGSKFKVWIPVWSLSEAGDDLRNAQVFQQITAGTAASVILLCVVRFANRFLAFALMVFAAAAQFLFGTKSSAVYFAVFFCVCLLLFCRGYTLYKRPNGMMGCPSGDMPEQKTGKKIAVGSFGLILAASAACGVCSLLIPAENKNETLGRARQSLMEGVDTVRYGKDKSGFEDGDFSYVSGKSSGEETALEVTMETPQSVYLRGFVGERFSGNRWEERDGKEQYQTASLFYWLHKEGFFGEGQMAEAFQAFEIEKETSAVTVKHVGASRKYKYIPYEYLHTEDGMLDEDSICDGTVRSGGVFGETEYSYEVMEGLTADYQDVLNGLISGNTSESIQKYRGEEQHYNSYVYDAYTWLDEETEQILENCLGAYQSGEGQHVSYEKAKETILNYLSERMTYNEDVSGRPENFLKEFLETGTQGYDIHYATAAALMFRYYGIPARYVEGYLVTPTDAKNMNAGEAFSLPASNAHAWVEYYQDGVGWIPFEATPPYIGVMEEAKIVTRPDTKDQSGSELEKKRMTEDNYEQDTAREKPDFSVEKIKQILPVLILAVLAACVCIYILRAVRILRNRRKQFLQEDANAAIVSVFTYMMEMLFSYAVVRENQSLAAYGGRVQKYEAAGTENYDEILAIYRRARFSDRTCDMDERRKVENYMRTVNKNVYRSLKWYEKIKWRFWNYME